MITARDDVLISAIWWRFASICRYRRSPCFIALFAAARRDVIVGIGVRIRLVLWSIGGEQVIEYVIGYKI